jgi:hypothetical protein
MAYLQQQRNTVQQVRPNTHERTPLREYGEVWTADRNLPVHVRGDESGTELQFNSCGRILPLILTSSLFRRADASA